MKGGWRLFCREKKGKQCGDLGSLAHLKSKRGTKKFEYFLVKERNAESLREEKLRSLRVLKRGFEGKGFGSTREPFKECVVLILFYLFSHPDLSR